MATLITLLASSQVPYYDSKKFKENNKGSLVAPFDNLKIPNDSLQKILEEINRDNKIHAFGTLIHTQPNGTRVYAMPQDNTICLVPDISQYNMPVAGKEIKILGMPPKTSPRYKVFPKK
jgi:hypothetical protein